MDDMLRDITAKVRTERLVRELAALRADSPRGGEATVPDTPAPDRALGYGEEGV